MPVYKEISPQFVFFITAGCTDKKENKIYLKYKEIQMGTGAKLCMRKGFLIYEELHKYIHHIPMRRSLVIYV